jgi:hypothetical protein
MRKAKKAGSKIPPISPDQAQNAVTTSSVHPLPAGYYLTRPDLGKTSVIQAANIVNYGEPLLSLRNSHF